MVSLEQGKKKAPPERGFLMCPGTDLNRRHADFQSAALPTELPGRSTSRAGYCLLGVRLSTRFRRKM